ncbi:MAG: GTPase domain-containing protein [Chloroflexota bacterium]|nr:GTPase domain-containing protein [Chloroflexota bacterium]
MDTNAIRTSLTEIARLLDRRADRLAQQGAQQGPRWERLRQLREHLHEYLLPRVRNLDAPLVATIIGSTGSGKSSLINSLAGQRISPSGVLRPTTRQPVVLATSDDAKELAAGELLPSLFGRGELQVVTPPVGGRSGVLIVDAPDVDSVEARNRALAVELLDASDLCIVVTTAARYADHVPWQVLDRARQRGLPLLAVLNRLPTEQQDAAEIAGDYERMLARQGFDQSGANGELEVVPIVEGAIDPAIDGIRPSAVRRIAAAVDRLATNKKKRQELAQRALEGALRGLAWRTEAIADDVDSDRVTFERLTSQSVDAYRDQAEALRTRVQQGRFLRDEVVRQWHEFVGAGFVARGLASGMERLTTSLRTWLRPPPPAPVDEVEEGAFSDLTAVAVSHAQEAARRSATAWSGDPIGSRVLAAHPTLWTNDDDFSAELRGNLERWIGEIGAMIGQEGHRRRGFARAASLSVNVLGVGVMLAAFGTTGGLTGAEFGIAAATALLNQRLLETIFGEATLRSLVNQARERLLVVLDDAMERDRTRFDRALARFAPEPDAAEQLRSLARRVAAELR